MTDMTCDAGERHYAHRIVDVVDELHSWASQGDPYGLMLYEALEYQTWLEERLKHWSWGETRSAYDVAIYALITATLVEVKSKWDALVERDRRLTSQCPQVGTGGRHSNTYYDDGSCCWCGAEGVMA